MKRSLIPAALAAILVLGAFPAAAQAQPRVIAVTGRATIPYTPEFVDLDFAVVTRDAAFSTAQEDNLAAVGKAMALLTGRFGMKREDVTTLDWRLQQEQVYSEGQRQDPVYVATTRMRARVRDLGAYRAVVVGLLDSGVNTIDSIEFGVADWEGIREQALKAACADAERMAKAMAATARATLGRVMSLRENEAAAAPVPVMFAKAAYADAAGNNQVISSGNRSYEATVYAEYELR